jgi:hypothetical protein
MAGQKLTDEALYFYTLGYGNAPQETLIQCIQKKRIGLIIDVRRITEGEREGVSATELQEALQKENIAYEWLPELGNMHDTLPWKRHPQAPRKMRYVLNQILTQQKVIGILCAENPGLRYGADRCHRIRMARQLRRQLGPPWDVQELWMCQENGRWQLKERPILARGYHQGKL